MILCQYRYEDLAGQESRFAVVPWTLCMPELHVLSNVEFDEFVLLAVNLGYVVCVESKVRGCVSAEGKRRPCNHWKA